MPPTDFRLVFKLTLNSLSGWQLLDRLFRNWLVTEFFATCPICALILFRLPLPQMAWLGFFSPTRIPGPGIKLTSAQLHIFEGPSLRMLYRLSYRGRGKLIEPLHQFFFKYSFSQSHSIEKTQKKGIMIPSKEFNHSLPGKKL